MDPYANPDQQTDATIQAMITRLEERGRHPAFLRMIDQYAAELPRERPLKVLDLGCGTGVVIRRLEGCLHPESVLHGADVSQRLLAVAGSMEPGSRIQWEHVGTDTLPYEAGVFDCVVMHTLLSHVPAPEWILAEAGRVLKKDGVLVVFDADHAGTTYGQADYARMREIDFKLTSAIARNPDICRQMPRHLKASGFRLVHHRAELLSECGKGDFWLSSVRGFARLIPALGILPEVEGAAWVDGLLKAHEEGTFFAAGAYYTFHAVKA